VAVGRYYQDDKTWQQKKLDCLVPMPETLDLAALRARGKQDGETDMPEETAAVPAAAAAAPAPAPVPDDIIVAQLLSMGFDPNGCQRAALATGNSSAESAMEWVFAHMADPDFTDPLPPPAAAAAAAAEAAPAGGGGAPAVDPEQVGMLTGMGFAADQATAVLKHTSGDVARAADWLFSHSDDLAAAIAVLEAPTVSSGGGGGGGGGGGDGDGAPLDDGEGKYTLVGFISHIGKNTGSGHYVAHVKKDGRWVIFDDQKVAASDSPPLDLGYVYMYRRRG